MTAQEMEAKAAGWREYADHIESIDDLTDAMELMIDMMHDEAWRLDDAAAVLRAQKALESPLFAAQAISTLPTMPAGPTNLGDPGVWYGGREYWAYEVVDLYTKWIVNQ